MSVIRAVAADSAENLENSNDIDSCELIDDRSMATDSDEDDSEDSNESNDDELAIEDQHILGNDFQILDRQKIHDPIIHQNIHCPPFNDMELTFRGNPHGICDCDDFCFAMCVQENNFEYFKSANYVIAFDDLLIKAGQNIDSEDRRSNNELRKSLYKKIFCALDFGVLEPGERRRLPNCAVAKVRQIYPSDTGYYMGFKEK